MAGGVDRPTGQDIPDQTQNNSNRPAPGSIAEQEEKLNPLNVKNASDVQEAFEMSVFNLGTNIMSQGNNRFKEILDESNKQEQRRKMVMGMIKSGLT